MAAFHFKMCHFQGLVCIVLGYRAVSHHELCAEQTRLIKGVQKDQYEKLFLCFKLSVPAQEKPVSSKKVLQ